MANISKEERERRKAAAAAAAENPPEVEAPPADPNADVDIVPPMAYKTEAPVPPPVEKPAPEVVKKNPDPGTFDVDEKDFAHFQAHKLKEEKQKSLDAIEQAVADAQKIAANKIRQDPVVLALAADPGDVGKRVKFLQKFGPSNVKPPRPLPTPFGLKDPVLMEWMAKYEPDNFISTYGKGSSPLVKQLLATIRRDA